MQPPLLVETADSPVRRLLGLTGRASLAPGHALFIPRCRCVHTLGMRFSIDVAFLRLDRDPPEVLAVRERVRPCRLAAARAPRAQEVGALELAAGEARRLGIQPGSRLPRTRFL